MTYSNEINKALSIIDSAQPVDEKDNNPPDMV